MTVSTLKDTNVVEFVNGIVEQHGKDQSSLIPILQDIQKAFNYLPEELLTYVATAMDLSPATVFGVATFYAQFSLEPKGKYIIKVCDGTACHVRGSMPVYEAIRKKVKLTDGKITTDNKLYTVETVSCLGACGLAPVITINDKVYGQVTTDAIKIILETLESEEASA